MAEVSPVQQFILGTPLLPISGATQQFVRATPLLPVSGAAQQFVKAAPIGTLGIRGPQIEYRTLANDRFESDFGFLLGSTFDIDLTTTGQTTIYTVPASVGKVIILGVALEISFGLDVTVAPQVSLGVDPSTDNLFAPETLTEFTTDRSLYTFWSNLNITNIAATGSDILLDVTSASTATALFITAHVFGIEIT